MRIGFLLNHEQIHQVAHCVPIACALSRRRPDLPVTVIASSDAQLEQARRIAAGFPNHRCSFVRIGLPRPLRHIARLANAIAPFEKVAVLRHNAGYLKSFDALVVAEKTSLLLKTRFGADRLKLIHTRHGAGDRAISFDADSGKFDLVLLSGAKIADRLSAAGCLPQRYDITGYAKFDAFGGLERTPQKLFDNDRTTVLYSPHPSPHLSSWYKFGRRILAFFYASDDYNLIFAPHVMLFHRRFNISLDRLSLARPGKPDAKYAACDHILVDLGSAASTDMTYTLAADVYLGDVSSQIYEFLARPRPCLFVDSGRRDWIDDPNFLQWRAGPVLTDIDALDTRIRGAVETHAAYRKIQGELFAYSCDIGDRPASQRAADSIAAFLDGADAAAPAVRRIA